MRTKTMLDCIKLSVFFTVVLGLALAVVFYATITFGQEIVPTAASAQESAMRVGTPPAYPNMNKHAAVEEDEEEAAPFLSRQGGYRMADFMNSESLPGLDYSSNRWLHTRRIQSLSEPKSSFSVARVAMQSSPVAMARDYGHIFSEARTEIDNFNLRASKIEMDLAVVEKVHYIYEKTDYLKKEISPDDPDVQEMIEKAKDDIIERFDLDENERDKIKVVRIEPGWSIYPYPEPLDFLYINEDLLLSDGVKTVWNEKDRVYNTVDSDVGLTFSCLGCGEATEALGTTRSENDATARITSKDPSSLVRDILSGGVPASAGDSTGMDKLSGSTCYATEGASLLGMDNDLTSSYAVRRIPSIIRPIIRPIPFYDYKIVFAYTADEEDPNRTEMELEYLVAKNEVRISMATTKVYGNGRLKREICNSYDWSGNIVKMSLTTFKYNQDGSLKKATSVLLDRDFRKYAEIVISYKYHANGEVKIKKIKRDDFDRNEELICSTISKYEYNEDGQIVYHVEKYKNAQEPGYAVTMEETYEYDRGRLVRVTRKHYDHNHALYSKCVETYEYHGNGNSKNKTVETSYYRDGAVYYRYVNNYVYNKKGNLKEEISECYDAQGRRTSYNRTTIKYYDGEKRKEVETESIYYSNGEIYRRYVYKYSYDRSSRQTLSVYKQFDRDNNLVYLSRTSWEYEGDNLVRYTEEHLRDGEIIITLERTYRYENGKEVESVQKVRNNDGELVISRIRRKYYDDQTGNIIKEETEYYHEDQLTSKEITTYKYDADGFNYKITYIAERFENEIKTSRNKAVYEYVQDNAGYRRLESMTIIYDTFSDGNHAGRTKTVYIYDEKGRNTLFKMKTFKVIDGELVLISKLVVSYKYNDDGILVEKKIEEKIFGTDGNLLEWYIETRKFNAYGRTLSFLREVFDANGEILEKYADEYEYDDETGLLIRHAKMELIDGEFLTVYEVSYEYDDMGRMTRYTERVLDDETGELVNYYQVQYTYDEDGRMTIEIEMIPDDNGQFVTYRKSIWTYEEGRLVCYIEMGLNSSGELVVTLEERNEYDERGRLIYHVEKRLNQSYQLMKVSETINGYNGDGKLTLIISKRWDLNTGELIRDYEVKKDYDQEGRLIFTSTKDIWWGTGTIYEYTYEYDDQDSLKTQVIVERRFEKGRLIWEKIYIYDYKDGRLITYSYDYKGFSNGEVRWWNATIREYDSEDRLICLSHKNYDPQGQLLKWNTTNYDYDKNSGREICKTTRNYFGQKLISKEVTVSSYDDNGRLTGKNIKIFDGDNKLESEEICEYKYDSQTGRIIQEARKTYDASGNLRYLVVKTWVYDNPEGGYTVTTEVKRFNNEGEISGWSITTDEYVGRRHTSVVEERDRDGNTICCYRYTSEKLSYNKPILWRIEKLDLDTGDYILIYEDKREYEHGILRKRTVTEKVSNGYVRSTHEYNEYEKLTLHLEERSYSATGGFIVTYEDKSDYDGPRLLMRTVRELISGDLVLTYRETCKYNDMRKLTLRLVERRIHGTLIVTHRDTYEYDETGKLLLHVVEERISGELVEIYRETYEYNEQGKCVLHERWEWEIEGLVLTLRDIYRYDDAGHCIYHLLERRINGQLVGTDRWTYKYDAAGRNIYYLREEQRGNRWFALLEEETRYNDRGIKVFHKRTVDEKKITIYEYNDIGKMTRYEEQDVRNGETITLIRHTREYDSQYRLIEDKLEKIGEDGILHKSLVKRFSYDGDFRLLRYEEENYDSFGNLTTVYILNYTYDSLGRLRGLRLTEKVCEQGELHDKTIIVFEYNRRGQLELYNEKVFDGGILTSEKTIEYTYSSTGNKSKQKEIEVFYDGSGEEIDYKKVDIYTFNRNGRLSKYKQLLYDWKDGNYMLVDYLKIEFYYNGWGQKIRMKVTDKEFDSDGNYLGKVVETSYYNDQGRINRIVTLTYDSNDNLISKEVVKYGYDENGNRIIITDRTLYDKNGEELKRSVNKVVLDKDGNLIAEEEVEYDKDGNVVNSEDKDKGLSGDSEEVLERLKLNEVVNKQFNDHFSRTMADEKEALELLNR